jgi:general secretion pathway protein N
MKRYVFAGLLVFLIVLLVSFPARVAYQWFAPPDVQLSGISGSIWRGSAVEGLAGGAYLRDISWRLHPAELLTGKLAFTTSASPASGTLHTDVALGLDGSLTLTDFSGNLPLDLVHQAFQQEGISGDLSMQFETLTLKNALPVVAVGSVTVANFYAPKLSAGVLGDYRADFQTTDSGITGNVDDLAGVLDIAGVITISPDRNYSLIGDVATRPGAPPSIESQLRFLGSPDARGMRPFRFEGQL